MNNNENPYANLLGIEVIETGIGTSKVRTRVKPEHINKLGYAHGGFIYSIADVAFELASNSHEANAVGITTTMVFHLAIKNGAMVEATAKEIYLGNKIATYQIEVFCDEKIIASFTGTVYRMQAKN